MLLSVIYFRLNSKENSCSLETKRLIQLSDSIDCDIVDKMENFTSVSHGNEGFIETCL